jgi:putative salt-induced outer membrane protein YdiY
MRDKDNRAQPGPEAFARFSRRAAAAAIALLASALGLAAQDAPPPSSPRAAKIYFSSTSFSLLLTRGNNQNLSYSVDTDHNLTLTKNVFNIKGNVIYTRANGQPRSGIYYSHVKYDRQLNARAYLLGLTRFERNTSAGYLSRVSITTGGGFTWIKVADKLDVSSEISLGWSGENNIVAPLEAGGEPTTRAASFVSTIMTHKLNCNLTKTAQLSFQGVVFNNLKDLEAFRVNSYTALSASISASLALKTSFQVVYDNQPVAGYKPTDIYFLSSLVVKM